MDIFVNGQFLPTSQATISVQDRGLLYGDGLFETMRAEAGRPVWLEHHLARLEQSAAVINLTLPADFPWESRIQELLERNSLIQQPAAVKILITRGTIATLGLPETREPTLIISARRYDPPPAEEYIYGWPVITFPERRLNFLSRHKSLNYLFCLSARQYALERGGREGLILEADGTIAEGATTAVLWQEEHGFFTPAAGNKLPSVTAAILENKLRRRGEQVAAEPATPSRLAASKGVWLANSLMGLLPVSRLDGEAVAVSADTAGLNKVLWSEGL